VESSHRHATRGRGSSHSALSRRAAVPQPRKAEANRNSGAPGAVAARYTALRGKRLEANEVGRQRCGSPSVPIPKAVFIWGRETCGGGKGAIAPRTGQAWKARRERRWRRELRIWWIAAQQAPPVPKRLFTLRIPPEKPSWIGATTRRWRCATPAAQCAEAAPHRCSRRIQWCPQSLCRPS